MGSERSRKVSAMRRKGASSSSNSRSNIGRKHVHTPETQPKKRRWSVLEVFTWTCAISMAAACRGWHAYEPVSLPHWDLMKDKDYTAALKYIDGLKLRMRIWKNQSTRAKLKKCILPAFQNLECVPPPRMKLFGNQQLECLQGHMFFPGRNTYIT